MTSQDIERGNRLIAEFDGVKLGEDKYSWRPGCTEPLQVHHLNYHKEWGWLMPAAKKILGLTPIQGKAMQHILQMEVVVSALMVADIDKLYAAVLQFLEWYNSQSC